MTYRFTALTDEAWEWVKARASPVRCEDTKGIVAWKEDGTIAAVVIMDSWAYNSVQVHLAIDDPMVLRHGLFEEAARHIHEVCDRDVIIGLVPADNAKAIKLNTHMGYREVYRVRDGYKKGVDYIIMELRREDNRWLRSNSDGRKVSTKSARLRAAS